MTETKAGQVFPEVQDCASTKKGLGEQFVQELIQVSFSMLAFGNCRKQPAERHLSVCILAQYKSNVVYMGISKHHPSTTLVLSSYIPLNLTKAIKDNNNNKKIRK